MDANGRLNAVIAWKVDVNDILGVGIPCVRFAPRPLAALRRERAGHRPAPTVPPIEGEGEGKGLRRGGVHRRAGLKPAPTDLVRPHKNFFASRSIVPFVRIVIAPKMPSTTFR